MRQFGEKETYAKPPATSVLANVALFEGDSNQSRITGCFSLVFKFSYMLDQCGNCQVIIVENEIPDDVDFSAANLIEFTKNRSIGRYGFLLDQLIL